MAFWLKVLPLFGKLNVCLLTYICINEFIINIISILHQIIIYSNKVLEAGYNHNPLTPSTLTAWTNWPKNDVYVSNLNWQFFLFHNIHVYSTSNYLYKSINNNKKFDEPEETVVGIHRSPALSWFYLHTPWWAYQLHGIQMEIDTSFPKKILKLIKICFYLKNNHLVKLNWHLMKLF